VVTVPNLVLLSKSGPFPVPPPLQRARFPLLLSDLEGLEKGPKALVSGFERWRNFRGALRSFIG